MFAHHHLGGVAQVRGGFRLRGVAWAKCRAAWVMAVRPSPPAAPTISWARRAASSHFSSAQASDSALVSCSAVDDIALQDFDQRLQAHRFLQRRKRHRVDRGRAARSRILPGARRVRRPDSMRAEQRVAGHRPAQHAIGGRRARGRRAAAPPSMGALTPGAAASMSASSAPAMMASKCSWLARAAASAALPAIDHAVAERLQQIGERCARHWAPAQQIRSDRPCGAHGRRFGGRAMARGNA